MSGSDCPCGSGKPFAECCQPLIEGEAASSPEALMRSRYSAFATDAIDYIMDSHHSRTVDGVDRDEVARWAEGSTWLGLTIDSTSGGAADDDTGTVRFIARYQDDESGTVYDHRETALFEREDGDWKFLDSEPFKEQPMRRDEPKVGRNDPCPCGSGKKYKRCCGAAA